MKSYTLHIFVALLLIQINCKLDPVGDLMEDFKDMQARTGNIRVTLTKLKLNDYIDEILMQMNYFMTGLEKVKLEDVRVNFDRRVVLITYPGNLDLTQGILKDLSKIRRNGNTIMSYGKDFVKMKIPLSIDRVRIEFNYSAKFMYIGPVGRVKGEARDISAFLTVYMDLETQKLSVDSMEFKAKEFEIEFLDTYLTTWIIQIFSEEVKGIIYDELALSVKSKITEETNKILDVINGAQ